MTKAAKNKLGKKKKVVGFNILENECIWMKAGVINFKLCDNAYDCINCEFDKAMSKALEKAKEGKISESWRESMRKRSGEERLCRHMITGRVPFKICHHNFECETCEFDQSLEDTEPQEAMGETRVHQVYGYLIPDDYYFHDGHTWARVEYGGRIRVGLDDFAVKLVGPVDEFILPGLGAKVRQMEPGLRLARESNEAEVLSPVEGTVIAVNTKILKEPRITNKRPYSDGWLYVVEPRRLKTNLRKLLFGEETDRWMEKEVEKLYSIVMPGHERLAATGGKPIEDVYGTVPEIGWKKLVGEFLKT